jgi:putative tricarboxylic transport membrane protein
MAVGLLLSVWSTRYQIGTLTQPGSGLFPLGLGVLLTCLSINLLLQARKSSLGSQALPSSCPEGEWKKVAYTLLVMFLGTLLFEKIGYLLTIFLLITFLMYGGGSRNWRTILLVAFFSVTGVYLVFVLLLRQLYPRGLLGI